ncbi:MAG: hypothetical protein C0402_04030 [Thermodesulfovibrio sp.]|nr:hypothetical protein [Thermodesulfovibrio sp.]
MYFRHKSSPLNEAFIERPFQGVEPESAKFIFVGLDANYDQNIENSPIFPRVLEYLKNGAMFWKQHKVHHPFLLPEYKGDGRRYHKTFADIGFTPEDAEDISFVELLHLPTYGRSRLDTTDLDAAHLQRLNNVILHGRAQFIFIPGGVGRLMKESGFFSWMPQDPMAEEGPLKVWFRTGRQTVYWHYHFSVYGSFEREKQRQLGAIAALKQ